MTTPRILITDDEPNIRLMLRTALESEGYEIDEAVDGQDALEKVEQSRYGLMLLDLNMPVLDGMGVLTRLRELKPELKPRVLILTAYGSIPAAVKATRLGAMDFLEKPITPDDLRETVASALAETQPEPRFEDALLDGGYDVVLNRVRRSLRMADFSTAESLLMKAADLKGMNTAPYFNLLGVLYEAQRKWRLARKCYGKAIAADGRYDPAQQNMRRIYELYTFGRSKEPIALGDEMEG